MESLEMWCAENVTDHQRWSFEDAKTRLNYNPFQLAPYSRWMRLGTQDIGWHRAIGIADGAESWIPAKRIRLDFSETSLSPLHFELDSTGLASGNSYVEAMLHSLYEIVERDGLARGAVQQVRSADLVLSGLGFGELVECLMSDGVRLKVASFSSIVDLPIFSAQLQGPDQLSFWGSGCHLSPRIAISRAVTEAAQSRITHISGAREDIDLQAYSGLGTKRLAQSPSIRIMSKDTLTSIPTEPTLSLCLNEHLRLVRHAFLRARVSPLVADLSVDSDAFVVVFAIAPGLKSLV
jgi:ribosomal protein S12 methylthiotransferase accessory factor